MITKASLPLFSMTFDKRNNDSRPHDYVIRALSLSSLHVTRLRPSTNSTKRFSQKMLKADITVLSRATATTNHFEAQEWHGSDSPGVGRLPSHISSAVPRQYNQILILETNHLTIAECLPCSTWAIFVG